MILIDVKKARVRVTNDATLTTGMQRAEKAKFTFSADWNGLIKTIVWRNGSVRIAQTDGALDQNGEMYIPREVMREGLIEVGVYGTDGDAAILPSVWADVGRPRVGATHEGENADEIAAPLIDQVRAEIPALNAAADAANAAASAASGAAQSVLTRANRGEFDGATGATGATGAQGIKGDSGVYVGAGAPPDGYDVQIDPSGDAEDVVLCDRAQALTDAQKARARSNINAEKAQGAMALIEKIIVGYSLTTSQPADWATNYTAYFTRSGEPTDESMAYVAVTGDSAPAWAAGTYYGYDAAASEIVHRDTNPDGSPYGYAGFVVELDMTQMADASLSGFVYAKALRNGQLVSVTKNYFLALGSSGRKYMCLWISPSMGKWHSNGLYMASKDYLYPTYNANGMIDVYFSTESNIAESPAVNCIDMNVPLKSNAIVKLYGVTA